jgi:hypothetical protein
LLTARAHAGRAYRRCEGRRRGAPIERPRRTPSVHKSNATRRPALEGMEMKPAVAVAGPAGIRRGRASCRSRALACLAAAGRNTQLFQKSLLALALLLTLAPIARTGLPAQRTVLVSTGLCACGLAVRARACRGHSSSLKLREAYAPWTKNMFEQLPSARPGRIMRASCSCKPARSMRGRLFASVNGNGHMRMHVRLHHHQRFDYVLASRPLKYPLTTVLSVPVGLPLRFAAAPSHLVSCTYL